MPGQIVLMTAEEDYRQEIECVAVHHHQEVVRHALERPPKTDNVAWTLVQVMRIVPLLNYVIIFKFSLNIDNLSCIIVW